MMKRTAMMAIAGLWLCAVVTPQAQEAPKTAPATHVTKEQIQEFIAKLPRGRISDSPIRAIDVGGYRWVCSPWSGRRTRRRTRFTTTRT
jgi:hypothetical protein